MAWCLMSSSIINHHRQRGICNYHDWFSWSSTIIVDVEWCLIFNRFILTSLSWTRIMYGYGFHQLSLMGINHYYQWHLVTHRWWLSSDVDHEMCHELNHELNQYWVGCWESACVSSPTLQVVASRSSCCWLLLLVAVPEMPAQPQRLSWIKIISEEFSWKIHHRINHL